MSRVSEYDVRRPDLFYFSRGRRHLIGDEAAEGPPDLAVEVISAGRVRGSGSDVVKLPPFAKLQIPLAQLWRPK
ncbi:MAG: hypothetical protein QOF78_4413 [Phycisphaerales bacterium]|jgi:Uma2 family endonuclease|nr:hypothetical protein [Phycisphaerales bacterium]